MKNKFLILFMAGILTLGFAGCGQAAGTGSTSSAEKVRAVSTESASGTSEEKVTAVSSSAQNENIVIVGTKAKDAYCVRLKNSSGKEITGISIKAAAEASYPAGLTITGSKIAIDEIAQIYYAPSDVWGGVTTDAASAAAKDYSIQLTFADNTTGELHSFPFADIEEGEIKADGEILYLTYQSISQKKEINTLEAEKTLKSTADAKAKADADAKAKADADAAAAQAAAAQAAADQAAADQAAADQAAADQAAQDSAENTDNYSDQTYTDNNQSADQGSTDNSGGCLNGGLTY